MSDTPRTDEVAFKVEHRGINNAWETEHVYSSFARELEAENEELREWKKSAISVMPPIQEIGKELNVRLGHSVHDKILPGIQALKAENKRYQRAGTVAIKDNMVLRKNEMCHQAERAEILELLKGVEWKSFHGYYQSCPCCRREMISGHTDDCKLAAMIKKLAVCDMAGCEKQLPLDGGHIVDSQEKGKEPTTISMCDDCYTAMDFGNEEKK